MAEPIQLTRTWQTVVTMCALTFNAALVAYLVAYGEHTNSLHTSALAWAFGTSVGILAGIGIGVLAPLAADVVKSK